MEGSQGKRVVRYDHPVLFEVDINHLCWFIDLTEKNPDASMVSTMSTVQGNTIINIVQLTSPTPKKDIEFIRKHPLVKAVEVVLLNPASAMLKVTSSYQAMTYHILHRTNVTLLESPVTTGGIDTELLLARTHKDMDELLSRWREQKDYYDVKLKKKRYLEPGEPATFNVFRTGGFFDLKSAKSMLTPKQLEVFRLACDYGYYDMPKKITIEELAERTGMSPSTLAEHLRKAETRLLPVLWKVLNKI